GSYTYVSPKVTDILGYAPSELLNKMPFDFMDDHEATRIKQQFDQAVENKGAIEGLENTYFHKDGRKVVLETSGVPVIEADGRLKGYRGMDRDITARRKTESELRNREATLNSIFRAAPIGIGMVADRILTWVNDNMIEMTGYAHKDLIGSSARMLYPDQEEFDRVGQEKYAQIETKGTGTVETRWQTKEGNVIDVLLSSTPLNLSDWSQGVTFTALDITARKQSEKQLIDSERNYREIFDAANDVVMIHDKTSGEIVDANSKASDLYGYEPSELYGMTVESMSQGEPPFTMVEAAEWIKKTVEEGPQVFEWMARDKKGNAFWVEVSLKNALIGGKDRLLAVIRDIRQRKAADKEIAEYREHLEELVDRRAAEIKAKNKELETFTYSVSHDLKAPLRGIDGYSRLLAEEYADKLDEEGLFFLNNVRQGATQMNKLIEDLLAYSRMERKDLHLTAIDLNSLIENLVNQRTHDMEQCRIKVTVDLPFQTIESDPETLRQVLANYLDNAIKYTKKDTPGTVTIGGRQDDDYWTVWVKDTGIGFDPKYLDRIFEIFQRLHRVEEYPGTGVGLAIVRKAVERIGGRVRADSTPGKGATFYLDIPKNNPVTP
ncbi:MAG: PAS domain S-box protein, partial [Desulfotignum sp.]|nr:PAS domain S-box protein [Desulfotignum sp.]